MSLRETRAKVEFCVLFELIFSGYEEAKATKNRGVKKCINNDLNPGKTSRRFFTEGKRSHGKTHFYTYITNCCDVVIFFFVCSFEIQVVNKREMKERDEKLFVCDESNVKWWQKVIEQQKKHEKRKNRKHKNNNKIIDIDFVEKS